MLCKSVLHKLQEISRHSAEVVPTGSVFEGFGKPLSFPQLKTNLGTDYDVMFTFKRTDLAIEYIIKDQEFLHIFSLTRNCTLLNRVSVFDKASKSFKISSLKARQLMKEVVNSVQKGEHTFLKSLYHNMWPFLYSTPRLSK